MLITLGDKKINYLDEGIGDSTYLFAHGWGGSTASLLQLHAYFKTEARSITIDLPGFGESDLPQPDWGIYEYADFLASFITTLKLNNVIYVGHSFGGAVGICLAAKTKLLAKLIVCAPSYKRETTDKKPRRLNAILKLMRKVYYVLFFPTSDLIKYPKLESNFLKIVTQDLTELLGDITIPTLILWGENDSATPIEHAKILNSNISRSKLVIFPELTHGFPIFNPDKAINAIKAFGL